MPSALPAESGQGQMNSEQMRIVMSKITELNQHIASTCDYVGKAFPEEARKIHYGETEHRAPVKLIGVDIAGRLGFQSGAEATSPSK